MATLRQQADKSETNGHRVDEASRVPASSLPVLIFASSLLIGQIINSPGPKPLKIVVRAETPTSIHQEIRRAALQKEYDRAARISRYIYRAHGCTGSFAELTARNAVDHKLPVRLVTAVVIVESTCRTGVISSEGAVGLMQVVPGKWHISRSALKNPEFNLRKGTEILSGLVHPYGIREGLHRYNGEGTGCPACDSGYVDKVLFIAGMKE